MSINFVFYLVKIKLFGSFSKDECYKQIDKLVKEDNNWSTLIKRYNNSNFMKRAKIIALCDILVDGRYIESQRNISAKWKGSDNQRCIDIEETLKQGEVVLYCE